MLSLSPTVLLQPSKLRERKREIKHCCFSLPGLTSNSSKGKEIKLGLRKRHLHSFLQFPNLPGQMETFHLKTPLNTTVRVSTVNGSKFHLGPWSNWGNRGKLGGEGPVTLRDLLQNLNLKSHPAEIFREVLTDEASLRRSLWPPGRDKQPKILLVNRCDWQGTLMRAQLRQRWHRHRCKCCTHAGEEWEGPEVRRNVL